jgi:hypothetical protein
MKYLIKTFQNDGDKKRISFEIEDSKGNKFAIDKLVDVAGSNEEMIAAAQAAAQPEIDEWQAQFAVIGRVWDADAGKLVDIQVEPEPQPEPVKPFVPDTPLEDPSANE